ncbi:FISUMP domain-containing protein [Fibrobacter sp. UBA4297]|uniref:FISUMP domain-containing protein n=1 Tax=Fibrobacter sp. UBA4297 TaxID=1946536 RepID=UPI0025B9B14A|nr:FISUMP domain-containing protein [Fibrobacter sp. UBA4297]
MKQFLATLSLVLSLSSFISLTACGDDSSTSVSDDNVSSSSSSSVIPASSGNRPSSSSQKIASSSSTPRNDVKSSSSKRSEGDSSSSSQKVASSSSSVKTASSSSSAIPASSGNLPSSSSKKVESSSSEYVPFDHSKTHANASKVGKDAYKQFTDPRNGRSYYYITIYSEYKGYSVTVMAENLNIGEMVLGMDNQNDDTKIERYCYNNDTTLCDEFGGLYQWAEMMQLPSRCNTESCSDLIQPNHQGICPDGWRLFTYDDFAVVMGYKDEFGSGIKGLRSAYAFGGNNYSGFSLTGAGMRTKGGGFDELQKAIFWMYPQEYEDGIEDYAYAAYVSSDSDSGTGTSKNRRSEKIVGSSVRCVKVER